MVIWWIATSRFEQTLFCISNYCQRSAPSNCELNIFLLEIDCLISPSWKSGGHESSMTSGTAWTKAIPDWELEAMCWIERLRNSQFTSHRCAPEVGERQRKPVCRYWPRSTVSWRRNRNRTIEILSDGLEPRTEVRCLPNAPSIQVKVLLRAARFPSASMRTTRCMSRVMRHATHWHNPSRCSFKYENPGAEARRHRSLNSFSKRYQRNCSMGETINIGSMNRPPEKIEWKFRNYHLEWKWVI